MATNDNALTCAKKDVTFWEMLAGAIGVDAAGKKYIRTHKVTPVPGSSGISCTNGISTDEELLNEFRNFFTLDTNGDIAIRVSQTE
jgi:hypothetical protein